MQLNRWIVQSVVLVSILFWSLVAVTFEGQWHAIAGQDRLHHSDSLLVVYKEKPDLLGGADEGVSINLYQDGYVSVHYPEYMTLSGNYAMYLDDSTMTDIGRLITNDLLMFDEKLARKEILSKNMARKEALVTLSNISDGANISIEIYPNRFQSTEFGGGDRNESKKIAWSGLKWDAKYFPQNEILYSLVKFQDLLLSVISKGNLERLD